MRVLAWIFFLALVAWVPQGNGTYDRYTITVKHYRANPNNTCDPQYWMETDTYPGTACILVNTPDKVGAVTLHCSDMYWNKDRAQIQRLDYANLGVCQFGGPSSDGGRVTIGCAPDTLRAEYSMSNVECHSAGPAPTPAPCATWWVPVLGVLAAVVAVGLLAVGVVRYRRHRRMRDEEADVPDGPMSVNQ